MSCNLIETVGGHKVARPIKTEQEYREIRNSSVQLANLRQARSGNAAAKGRLVQMNYSGHYPDGRIKGHSVSGHQKPYQRGDPLRGNADGT